MAGLWPRRIACGPTGGSAVLLPPLGFVPSQVEPPIYATPFLAEKITAQKDSLRVRVRIEPSLLRGPGNTVLELLRPHATTPRELGLSIDCRRLGLLVASISVSCRA